MVRPASRNKNPNLPSSLKPIGIDISHEDVELHKKHPHRLAFHEVAPEMSIRDVETKLREKRLEEREKFG